MSSSTSSSRQSVAAIALAFGAVLVVGVALLAIAFFDRLVEVGERELEHRPANLVQPQRPEPDVPLALFLGDSTFLPGHAYTRLLSHRLGEAGNLLPVWWEGFEPFHHYLVAGRALELEPEAVVIVAQTRVFWRHEPLWYADLLTLLPPRELPRAMLLPFHERSVSVPRVVLASLLGSLRSHSESAIHAFVGARKLAERIPLLRFFVPWKARDADPRRLTQLRQERFQKYGMPIYEGHPAVQALAATVEQAVRSGARTLVLVSPIPVDRLKAAGLYDEQIFADRVQVIQNAVEEQGGELLDLHAIQSPEDFTDEFGHMSESGNRKMALVIDPWLREALGITAKRRKRSR